VEKSRLQFNAFLKNVRRKRLKKPLFSTIIITFWYQTQIKPFSEGCFRQLI
jgi:hypothetical protein